MPRVGRRHTIEGILMYTVEHGEIILVGGRTDLRGGEFWTVGQMATVAIDSVPPKRVRASGRVTGFRDMVVEAIEVMGDVLGTAGESDAAKN